MTVLSVPGGQTSRGVPIEGEGPERAPILNAGPMSADETKMFHGVKDFLGPGVNDRALMQVIMMQTSAVKSAQSEGAMNDVVLAYLDRLSETKSAAKHVGSDKRIAVSSGTNTNKVLMERPTEVLEVGPQQLKKPFKFASSFENKEEQDMMKAIQESLKENQNIAGFSPLPQSDPENSHERRRSALCPVGLKNMGNSCWFNVISQTLFHIPQFRELLLNVQADQLPTRGSNPWSSEPSSSHEASFRSPSVTPHTLLLTLRRLYGSLLASTRGYIDPSDVLSTISELTSTLNKAAPSMGIQQDATEMLLRLIEWLEQALNKYAIEPNGNMDSVSQAVSSQSDEDMPTVNDENTDPNVSLPRFDVVPEPGLDQMTGNNTQHKTADQLPFYTLFHGSHIEMRNSSDERSTTCCNVENSMQMVNLDVTFDNLHDSLEAYHFADSPSKELWFSKLPSVTVFSLVRFSYKNGQTEKLHNKFHFPVDFLMDRYVHRNRAIVADVKHYRADLLKKLNIVKAQLNRIENLPVGAGTASASDIINAFLTQVMPLSDQHNEAVPSHVGSSQPMEVSSECLNQVHASGDNPFIQPHSPEGRLDDSVSLRSTVTKFINSMAVNLDRLHQELTDEADVLQKEINTVFDTNNMKEEGYRLHSVIIHEGEANVGHYWAYIADHTTLDADGSPTQWRKFNDKTVEPATWTQIEEDSFGSRRTCSAYCLVYTRKQAEKELFHREGNAFDSIEEVLRSLPHDLQADIEGDNRALLNEINDWDRHQAMCLPQPFEQQPNHRVMEDEEAMAAFSHSTPLNTDELVDKFISQGLKYIGVGMIKRSVEEERNGMNETVFWNDPANGNRVIDAVLKNWFRAVELDNEASPDSGRLFLLKWLQMTCIPFSNMAIYVYILRMLLTADKEELREAATRKLFAVQGSMHGDMLQGINHEIADASILYEIMWQTVAILCDITNKIESDGSKDVKQLSVPTKLLFAAARKLDTISPYMHPCSAPALDDGLMALLLDYLFISCACKLTNGLVGALRGGTDETVFDANAQFLHREFKALIGYIHRMPHNAGGLVIESILNVWRAATNGPVKLYKVESFHQMLLATCQKNSILDKPQVCVNVTVSDPRPDLRTLHEFLNRTALHSRCDLPAATNALINTYLLPYILH